jgi:hypothetical protein
MSVKSFSSVVSIQFYGNEIEAETKEEYIQKLKDLFQEEYNINLSDDEIGEIEVNGEQYE